MTKETITLLDPTAEDVPEQHPLATRLSALQGTTIGMVDNTKRNSELFLKTLETELRQRYGVSEVVHFRKANANTPAPAELLDQVASRSHAVIHAIAD